MKISQSYCSLCYGLCILLFFSCGGSTAPAPEKDLAAEPVKAQPVETKLAEPAPPAPAAEVLDSNTSYQYAWLDNYSAEQMLLNRISPPQGFHREPEAAGSFADWLRHLPLKPEGSPVYLFDGRKKGRQDVHHAVIDIDPGKRDLQQCADAVMRLKAEYHFANKQYKAIHFNYTSGDRVAFDDWARGRKPRVNGNKISFSPIGGVTDFSYLNFRKYLIQIFNYAGTASLSKELQRIAIDDLQIGDVFIKGGFPGHAVIILDVVQNEAGAKRFLLAQSYMPAQEIHILKNPANGANDPWYEDNFGEMLDTPEWRFSADELRRFVK